MPDRTPANRTGAPCSDYEDLILACFDQSLSESEKRRVESHLGGCRACEAFWNEQRNLDALLSASFARPVLRADFKDSLLRQVQAESARSPGGETAGPESELNSLVAHLRDTLQRRAAFALLDMVGYLAVGVVLAVVAQELLARLPVSAIAWPKALPLYVAWGATALCLSIGAWFGLKGEFRAAGLWR